MKEIAFELGLTDTNHFVRSCKKHHDYATQQLK